MFADRVTVTKLYISRDHHLTLKRDSIGRNYNTHGLNERNKHEQRTISNTRPCIIHTQWRQFDYFRQLPTEQNNEEVHNNNIDIHRVIITLFFHTISKLMPAVFPPWRVERSTKCLLYPVYTIQPETALTTGLTTGCIVYTNIQPVVKLVWQPDWQQVVSCKRGFTVTSLSQ